MKVKPQRAVYWLKRDFRLHDNPALTAALAGADEVLILFVYEPSVLRAPETSAFHARAWTEALGSLDRRLRAHGHRILVQEGELEDVLATVHGAWPFSMLYSHEEIGSELTFSRDKRVAQWCAESSVAWSEVRQTGVFRRLPSRDDRSRRWKAFMSSEVHPRPSDRALNRAIPANAPALHSLSFRARQVLISDANPEGKGAKMQRVSEEDAWRTLESFLRERALEYASGISSPLTAFETGSRLSIHLAWGTITARAAYERLEHRIEGLKGDPSPRAKQLRRTPRFVLACTGATILCSGSRASRRWSSKR